MPSAPLEQKDYGSYASMRPRVCAALSIGGFASRGHSALTGDQSVTDASPDGIIGRVALRHLRVKSTRLLRPLLEVFFLHVRQFLEECDDRPGFCVLHAGRSEARHAGHVDAVLDDPEQMARLALLHDLG